MQREHPDISTSLPDVSLFFEGQERVAHGPSRFVLVTSRTYFALALTWPIEASEEEAAEMQCNDMKTT